MSFAFSKKVQTCTTSLIPFFFWQLGHRESRESSKVSFELPEGFSVTAEKWQQQGMF